MRGKIVIGLILVILGVLILLANLGIINYSVFYSLISLWPLLLIVVGVNIIFRNNRIVSYLSWIIFFLILIVYGIFSPVTMESTISYEEQLIIQRREGTDYADLELDLGASRISFDSTEEHLLFGDFQGRRLEYREEYGNDNAYLKFGPKGFRVVDIGSMESNYDFSLNDDVIWDLDLDFGALTGNLNLEDISVRSIDLDVGAASLDIALGDLHDLDFSIDSGASSLEISIPNGVGLRVDMDTGLTSTNIESLGIANMGDYYVSPGYDSAQVKINLDIDMGAGKIDFRWKEL